MFSEFLKLHQFRNLGVCAFEPTADDELGVDSRVFGDEFSYGIDRRVVRRRDTQKNLDRAGVFLSKPAREAARGEFVGPFQRFQQCHAGMNGTLRREWSIARSIFRPWRDFFYQPLVEKV